MVTSKSAEVGDRILKVTFCFILMEEIWKDVVGYEGLYQVSNHGRVKSLEHFVPSIGGAIRKSPSKILTNCFDNNYYHVTLYKGGRKKIFLVHRLVAEAFIPNPNNLPQVNHKDGNKLNNNATNLEWCSAQDNILHAFATGLNTPHTTHYRGVKAFLFDSGVFVGEYTSQHEAADILGLNVSHICSVLQGRYKQTGGYYFEYNGKEKQQIRKY